MTDREKIIDIILDTDITERAADRIADDLIENDISDVAEWKRRAEVALRLVCWEMAVLDVCCSGCENEDNCRINFFNGGYKMKANECEKYWLSKADARLAELKGGRNNE